MRVFTDSRCYRVLLSPPPPPPQWPSKIYYPTILGSFSTSISVPSLPPRVPLKYSPRPLVFFLTFLLLHLLPLSLPPPVPLLTAPSVTYIPLLHLLYLIPFLLPSSFPSLSLPYPILTLLIFTLYLFLCHFFSVFLYIFLSVCLSIYLSCSFSPFHLIFHFNHIPISLL